MKLRHDVAVATLAVIVTIAACTPMTDMQPEISISPLLSPESPVTTPTSAPPPSETVDQGREEPTPSREKSALEGRFVLASDNQCPLIGVAVRIGRVFWNEDRADGAFAIEAGSSPAAITDANGVFYLADITPGDYVIVVGDLEGEYVVVSEPNNNDTARVFGTEAGQVLDVGELSVELSIR